MDALAPSRFHCRGAGSVLGITLPMWVLPVLVLILPVLSATSGPEFTDQAVSDKIKDELKGDPAVPSGRIHVSVRDGIATLTGRVSTILASERAARIADTVKGVQAVVNRVQVEPHRIADVVLVGSIEAALRQDPATEAYEIRVRVSDGTATLTGTVDSRQERELAEIMAKDVRGVAGIVNQITVDYKLERPDHELQEEIQQALRWNVHVDDDMIDVTVNDGRVALAGTVGSAAEKRVAEGLAWVAGVESVSTSRLAVDLWARDDKLRGDKYLTRPESEVRDAIARALAQDPRVLSSNVDVHVRGKTVTLRGEVASLSAKRAAQQDARNTVGVAFVTNRLQVRLTDAPAAMDLATAIREAYLRDSYIDRFDVSVAVVDGTAHLYGTVDTRWEKYRAENIAARIRGIADVENYIVASNPAPFVSSPYVDMTYVPDDEYLENNRDVPTRGDLEIASGIELELWWSPYVDSQDISVKVRRGVARLTGTVSSWLERDAATRNAYQGGAAQVKNELEVKASP